ncbi:MAG: DUF72 domain-containing protein [Chloroflexi bacterium]|nr:DUF72 domain-containing protein [Chloroflexota bacterium]
MARILVGTCSWTDPTLIQSGRFYPPSVTTAEARLQYYAQNFPLVEVDSSYYALPSEQTAGLWVERTPANFTFDVKAFSIFTHHPTPIRALPKDIREALPQKDEEQPNIYYRDVPEELKKELWLRFSQALLPLDSAGKLGVVLFQFPPWFLPSPPSREHILEAKKYLSQYSLAIEFRAATWLEEWHRDRTLGFLKGNDLAFVCVDEPQGFRSSVPSVAEATAPISLVRFHGRNRETWEKKGITATERFNYLYSEAELREWLPGIESLAAQSQEVHLLMNNCYQDKAVVNGRQLSLLVQTEREEK